jgi:predicted Ser/Thr protein kinase
MSKNQNIAVVDGKNFLPRDPFPAPFPGLKATLRDLLKVVRNNPAYVESTHSAFVRLIARGGIDELATTEARRLTGDENIFAYNNVTKKFFGVEEAVYAITVGYGRQGQEGGRAKRKALIIPGAPGAGKSDFVNFCQRDVMRTREPIPFLKYSSNYCNPLNALYLAKVIAQTKGNDIYDTTLEALVAIIDGLDLTGDAALNVNNSNLAAIVTKHGLEAGQTLTSQDLAEICMKSEKDFVAAICFGLDLTPATVDALLPSANLVDPFAKDAVLGRYFGKFGPDAKAFDEWNENAASKNKAQSKTRKHETYGEYDARYAVELGDYPIDNMFMSKGQGIVDVAEVQPINFDIAVWRGDKKLATMGLYDDEDPRTASLSGYFNRGKFFIMTEIFRNPVEGFRVLLESLEGGRLSLPEPLSAYHPEGTGWEGMIIGHANMEQWQKFYGNADHLAHLDRFSPKPFTYPLRPTAASQVTEKLYAASNLGRSVEQGGVHHEPLAFLWSGYFRVGTHLDWASKGNRPVMAVLRAYDGKKERDSFMGTDIDLRALREQAPIEGQTGMSPRALDDILGQLAAEALTGFERGERPSACFTTAELRDRLKLSFKTNPAMSKKDKATWIGWLDNEFETFRRKELTKVYKAAFIPNYKELCNQYFKKYREYVRALSLGLRPTGTSSGQSMTQRDMEAFLQEIERAEEFNINSSQAPKFRAGFMAACDLWQEQHPGVELPWEVHEGLKNCIESFVLRKAEDITGIIGVTETDPEKQKKVESARESLVKNHGYCKYCAAKLLVEVSLTRGFLKA